MLGQRGLGHPPRFSPLTSDRGPWPLGCCSVETAPFSTSTPNRNQLRPRPRGKALAGLSLGRRPGMLGHTPRDLLLNGAVPLEARKNWARLPKGRGCAALSLWPVGPLSRTGPLPVEHFPAASKGRFASTLAGCTRKPHTLLLRLGEKRFGEVFSQGRWPRAWGPVRGSTRTGQVRSTCKSLFMPPAHSGCSSKREGVRQLLGSPSSTARVERGRADLGAQWACCFPCCPVGAETKRSWPSTPFLPSYL